MDMLNEALRIRTQRIQENNLQNYLYISSALPLDCSHIVIATS